ncbi:EF-P lysine aminoacylase EpmA [Rhodoplanes sp. Z2-YC6860]|uniref:EF-P lysine aminoacylase EpmA n=1 Tax=Rhodoplanes sp. Z2-YC6860 TaxID=674703 RepID=UPI00078E343A|nr:EF-P lysine aminoacylase EpmA [Rhodoplanes sp. Z2-YC6860]AMN45336.1 lysyl-tRNA synthetase [Rhodoplanes sp. Z2-YC6860]
MTGPSPWWDRDRYAEQRPFLLARGRILSALREWFRRRGFLEAETPALQVSPGNEVHLHAFATELVTPGGGRNPLYLHTSPEFTCKKLLAAGEARVFSVGHVFRNRERGPLHHPEFTMLEWYRTNEPYEALMEDCAAILVEAAKAAGALRLEWKGKSVDPYAKPERLSVADAFQRFAGIDLLATLGAAEPDRDKLAAAAHAAGIQTAGDDTWSDIFSRILVERIEPQLGIGHAVLLDRYPLPEAAWAQPDADPRLARRFELYACGVELANGFAELTDAKEQQRRFEEAMAERRRRYGEDYPIDHDFLAALAQMPPASGIALGLDRLVMLATGATRIEQVLWAPVAGDDR